MASVEVIRDRWESLRTVGKLKRKVENRDTFGRRNIGCKTGMHLAEEKEGTDTFGRRYTEFIGAIPLEEKADTEEEVL